MIIEKIESAFRQYPGKRCLFLFDPSKEYEEDLKTLPKSINQILVDQRYFDVKIKVSKALRDNNSKVLLYHPFARPDSLSHYPLVGMLVSGIELRLDDVALFLEDYKLPENKRELAKKWIDHLNKTNRKKLAKILNTSDFTEDNLQRGMLCIAMDLNTVYDKDTIMMKFLSLSTSSEDLQRIASRITSLQLDDTFNTWLQEIFGLKVNSFDFAEIKNIVNVLKYNVIVHDIKNQHAKDNYHRLKIDQPQILNRLLNFYDSWIDHPKYKNEIETIFETLGSDIKEEHLFVIYGIKSNFGYISQKGFDYIINAFEDELYDELNSLSSSDVSSVKFEHHKSFLHRITEDKFTSDKPKVDFLSFLLLQLESSSRIDLFGYNNPENMLMAYCDQHYLIDTYFRKVESKYKKIASPSEKEVQLFALAQSQYNEYLIKYNSRFLELMRTINFDYDKISFPKQYNFYQDNITDVKTAVIISDAFRFELCKELELKLLRHDKNQIHVSGALASVPSFTQMGMTNLLPHKSIELIDKDTIRFKIDGIETRSKNRKNIIANRTSSGTAILYQDLIKLTREEGRALFKEHKLVYIYHNHVDAKSDKQELEDYTFEACEKGISELEKLTGLLFGWNVYHQYITADHGFLYNSMKLRDTDKEKLPTDSVYADSRSCITKADAEHDAGFEFPLRNVTTLNSDLKVIIPRAINRFRRQGKIGLKFVHGGASIQELVVPVLKYYKKNESVRAAVDVQRIDQVKKLNIPTNKFTLLQKESISNLIKPRTVVVALYSNEGKLVSNEVELNLSIISNRPSERSFHFNLTLNSEANNESFVKLKVFDVDNDKHKLNPIIEDILIVNLLSELDEF